MAHRREILEQAAATFRGVLRIPDFGELLVGSYVATRRDHLFCSVDMLQSRRLWEQVGADFYDFIVVDEVHHGPASSYRPVFDSFEPRILLGLTATPERMDGQSVAADFENRFAAEIRLAEALEEKLLCPFHYFGVADPVALGGDRFWKRGKYDIQALDEVYTGAHPLAHQRADAILSSLNPALLNDAIEIIEWSADESRVGGQSPSLPFRCPFELHARYGSDDIKAGLGKSVDTGTCCGSSASGPSIWTLDGASGVVGGVVPACAGYPESRRKSLNTNTRYFHAKRWPEGPGDSWGGAAPVSDAWPFSDASVTQSQLRLGG